MSRIVAKKYDDVIGCSKVLSEGIEQEFHKFVAQQEKCRKKWQAAEDENHETMKFIAKHKADQETLEVKLKMARHQLDAELKKRLKAEQTVDHMERQLELIKELLHDKDSDKESLVQSIYRYQKQTTVQLAEQEPLSYSINDSVELPDSEYDSSRNDLLDDTEASMTANARRSSTKRGRPSAPPAPSTTDDASDKKKRNSTASRPKYGYHNIYHRTPSPTDRDTDYGKKTKRHSKEVRSSTTHYNTNEVRFSTSPSKCNPPLARVDQNFERPPKPLKRPPSKTHLREFIGSTTTLDEDSSESDDKEEYKENKQEVKRTFSLTRQFKYGKQSEDEEKKTMTQHHTVSNLYPSLDVLGTPPKKKFNTLGTPKSGTRKTLLHSFVTKIAVRMETCGPCQKKLRFGSNVSKCKECKAVCHPECKDKVPVPCYPSKDTPGGKKDGAIESYVDCRKSPQVPDLVTQCIEEIERRGLKEQGLYRVSGMDKEQKELKEKFLRKKHPDLHKVVDTYVLCGCIKDFLRGLSEPLVTFALHESFMAAASIGDPDDRLSAMYQCVSELPKANRETLAALVVHLQRVACSRETQMNTSNLSKVFGPTLIGHRSSNPSHLEMLEDTKNQPAVVSCLLEMPTDYWEQFLNSNNTGQTRVTIKTPPYNPNYDHRTPECKEIPETLLGSVDPSRSQHNSTRKQYNAMTPKVISKDGKRGRHFFNSPS